MQEMSLCLLEPRHQEVPLDSNTGPCWMCSTPCSSLPKTDTCALLLKSLFLHHLSPH